MAVVAAITAGVATIASVDAQKTSARRQKRANQLQQNAQLGEDRTARQQSRREQRIRRARILQAGENTGTSGSSQESGFIGGQATAFAQAEGNQKSKQFANIAIGNQMQQAADAASRANTFQAISSLAMTYANFDAQQGSGGPTGEATKATPVSQLPPY